MMTASQILQQLDQCAADFTFPMLDNGYVYPADARLSVYRDESNWLMIIEVLGANNPRTCGYDSFINCLHLFGSALHREPGTANDDFLFPIQGCPDAPLFPDEFEWFARDDANCVVVRAQRIDINLSADNLARKGITLLKPPHIDPPAILRALLPEHRELLLASEEELALRNISRLPLWMRLDAWHHPDLANSEKPSDSETFRMLAAAISSGELNRYSPAKPPNTDWRNWPEGGTL